MQDLLYYCFITSQMRYLSSLACQTTLPHISQFCLQEMIARSCKKIFRQHLCQLMHKTSSEELSIIQSKFVTEFLNLIFINSEDSQLFWQKVIRIQVIYDYNYEVAREDVTMGGLFAAICFHCQINLAFENEFPNFLTPFTTDNFEGFVPKNKMFTLQTLQLNSLINGGPYASFTTQNNVYHLKQQRDQYLFLNNQIEDFYTMCRMGENCLKHLQYDDAIQLAEQALANLPFFSPTSIQAYFIIANAYLKKNYAKQVSQIIQTAISLVTFNFGNAHPLITKFYNILGEIFLNSDEYQLALKTFQNALNICLNSVNTNHFFTGLCNFKVALACEKMQNHTQAIEHFAQAFQIFESLDDQFQSNLILKLTEIEISTNLAYLYNSQGKLKESVYFATKAIELQEQQQEPPLENSENKFVLYLFVCDSFENLEDQSFFSHCLNEAFYLLIQCNYGIAEFKKLFELGFNYFYTAFSQKQKEWLIQLFETCIRQINSMYQSNPKKKKQLLKQKLQQEMFVQLKEKCIRMKGIMQFIAGECEIIKMLSEQSVKIQANEMQTQYLRIKQNFTDVIILCGLKFFIEKFDIRELKLFITDLIDSCSNSDEES